MLSEKKVRELIENGEANYRASLAEATRLIVTDDEIRIVLIAGASCAGKTTTTKRLKSSLEAFGKRVDMVSLDDFYKNPEDIPLNEEGIRDLESPESLDLEYLHTCLKQLNEGKIAKIPFFDFLTKRRKTTYTDMKLEKGDICIIEGLHALNPKVCASFVDRKNVFSIFLDAYTPLFKRPRFIRRLIRDYYFRNADAELTFSMWDNVSAGEEKYVNPFKSQADFTIDTYFDYETLVFNDYAEDILLQVKPDSKYYATAQEIIVSFSEFATIEYSQVPVDSLLWEFLPKKRSERFN